jgi:hypothetical protein
LRVELSVRDGVLNARLETETSSARNLLLDNLPALRDRLAELGAAIRERDGLRVGADVIERAGRAHRSPGD